MNLNLNNTNVVIVGGSRGIGLSTTEKFLEEGAYVHVISRNLIKSKLQNKFSSKISFYSADATRLKSLMDVLKLIKKKSNKIDVLISNVGNGTGSSNPLPSQDEWDISWDNNFISSLNSVRVFGPEITKSKGSIVFISSITGIEYLGAPSSYNTAKAALNAFAKTLSHKMAPNVRINIVAPGNVFIKNGTWDLKQKENPEKVKRMLNDNVPLNRLGRPDEIANLIVFLSSEKASFITGSCFVIDGGQTISY